MEASLADQAGVDSLYQLPAVCAKIRIDFRNSGSIRIRNRFVLIMSSFIHNAKKRLLATS
jgi:hypothetical protein